jgi:hypothetical protein
MAKRVFTEENMVIVRRMAADHFSAPEIAMAIGSTAASVNTMCAREGIHLGRVGDCFLGGPATKETRAAFNAYAARRGTTARQVTQHLLAIIASDDLFDAIFDGHHVPFVASTRITKRGNGAALQT